MAWRRVLIASVLLAGCASVERPPLQSEAYADFLVGRVAGVREDYVRAADRYFEALENGLENEATFEGAASAALASGDVELARRAARYASEDGAPAAVSLVRAVDALAGQRWGVADRQLARINNAAAPELTARMLMVWVNAARGDVARVNADLQGYIAIRPYGGLLAYEQALALDFAGQHDAALQAYAVAGQSGFWLPQGVARHADLLLRRGDRAQAMALLSSESAVQNPLLAAALARVEQGGAMGLSPLTPARGAAVTLSGLAAIFAAESDVQNAYATLTLAQMLDGDDDGIRIAFAQTLAERDRFDEALAKLAEIGAGSPHATAARRMEAWTLLEAGREDEAVARAEALAQSGDARARRVLADMYRSMSRYDRAEAIYSELAEGSPSDWRLLFARAAMRERLDRWDEAEADLQRALTLSPEQPDVMNYLAYGWIDRGERLAEGLAMLERALRLRPTSAAIMDSVGWAHYRIGDYARALEYIEGAVALVPADDVLNDHLGDVYWRLGRRIEARFQWRRALTLEPDNAAAIEAKLENGLAPPPRRISAQR